MNKRFLVTLVVIIMSALTLSGCSSEPKGEVKEVVDAIISDQTNIANAGIESNEDKYSYDTKDFSFRIWHETNTDEYIADVWVPFLDEPNSKEVLYYYKAGEVDLTFQVRKLSQALANGTFEEVYSSGKFND